MVCDRSDVFASACAIARAFPIFTRRSSASRKSEKKHVTVELLVIGPDSSPLGAVETEVRLDKHSSRNNFFIGRLADGKKTHNVHFSVSPTLLTVFAWPLALWTHRATK